MQTLVMIVAVLASAMGDAAIVVVDDPAGCVTESDLQRDVSVPTGHVLSVVVVGRADGGHVALMKLGRPDDPAPLTRVIEVDSEGCASVPAIVARIVARHLERLPVTAWPGIDDGAPPDDPDIVITAPAVDDDNAIVEVGVVGSVGSVVAGIDGFQRVSLRPTVRGLAPIGAAADAPVRLGLEGGVRLGALLPVAVGDDRIAGGDLVAVLAARTTWSRFSAHVGVEGGVLVLGDGTSWSAGPSVNVVGGVGVSFAPLWIDVVAQGPVVRAAVHIDGATVVETPVYLGLALGGFITLWP